MRKLTGILIGAMTLAFVVAASSRADAALMLQLSGAGAATQTFTDNGVGDLNPATGVLLVSESFGQYSLTVSIGQSYPALGTTGSPQIDLNFTATNSAPTSAPLVIQLTDTGYTGLGGGTLTVGGTDDNSVSYAAFWDSSNTAFGTTTTDPAFAHQIDGTKSFGPGAFSATGFGAGPNTSPYSLTQVITINNGSILGTTTGDANLKVPEPASLALFGMSLLGIAARRRRILG